MRLKLFTTVMLFFTLMLLVFRDSFVGPAPHLHSKRSIRLAYSERALGFTTALIVGIGAAGVGAILLVRQANEEYRRLAMENMQSLIEGAIEDHQKHAETSPERGE